MKILLTLITISLAMLNNVFAVGAVDVKATPPAAGTPEACLVAFIKAAQGQDKTSAFALMDDKAKKRYTKRNEKYWKALINYCAKDWDLSKEYKISSIQKEGYIQLDLMTVAKGGTAGSGKIFRVRQVNGKWLISSK